MSRARISTVRLFAAVAVALSAAGALSGCAGLPDGKRLVDGPAAQRAVARAISAPMDEATNEVTPTGIDGQSFTYYGTAHGVHVTLIVFDNAAATRFVLGEGRRPYGLNGFTVLRSRNIVLVYTASPAHRDLAMTLKRALSEVR